jgi:predicted dehydrogenase
MSKVKTALVGLGKMGVSHQAIVNAHPEVDLVCVCDSTPFLLDFLGKYTGVKGYHDFARMLADEDLDAVFIATPSRLHAQMVGAALDRGLHVFCEKPFVLDVKEGEVLVEKAEAKRLQNQVGYHLRFVGAFNEARRIVSSGALGTLHHIRSEVNGPVVLRPQGVTWRSSKNEGGGCLYDYACHAIDLVTYLAGSPEAVTGVVLNRVFSRDVDDEVYCTFTFPGGATGQLAANWSDESFRKMSSRITLWGTGGRLVADRQECQVYLREDHPPSGLKKGWTVKYTTDLTDEVWYYLRGEEYSAQVDYFIQGILSGRANNVNSFRSALATDRIVEMLLAGGTGAKAPSKPVRERQSKAGLLGGLFR